MNWKLQHSREETLTPRNGNGTAIIEFTECGMDIKTPIIYQWWQTDDDSCDVEFSTTERIPADFGDYVKDHLHCLYEFKGLTIRNITKV